MNVVAANERILNFLCGELTVNAVKLGVALTPKLADFTFVERAYLAKVAYASGRSGSALCIRTHNAKFNLKVAETMGAIFNQRFRGQISIFFLDQRDQADIERVCQPFYVRMLPLSEVTSTAATLRGRKILLVAFLSFLALVAIFYAII